MATRRRRKANRSKARKTTRRRVTRRRVHARAANPRRRTRRTRRAANPRRRTRRVTRRRTNVRRRRHTYRAANPRRRTRTRRANTHRRRRRNPALTGLPTMGRHTRRRHSRRRRNPDLQIGGVSVAEMAINGAGLIVGVFLGRGITNWVEQSLVNRFGSPTSRALVWAGAGILMLVGGQMAKREMKELPVDMVGIAVSIPLFIRAVESFRENSLAVQDVAPAPAEATQAGYMHGSLEPGRLTSMLGTIAQPGIYSPVGQGMSGALLS